MEIELKEALEKTKTVNEALKLIDESLFNKRMSDPWFKERLGEIYDTYISPNGWYVRAQKGDFVLGEFSIDKLEIPFKEKVEEIKIKSLKSRMLKLKRLINKEIDRKLKATFINEYEDRLYLLFEDGTAKYLKIDERSVVSKECPVVENIIVTGEMGIDMNTKTVYRVIGKNKDILRMAEKIQGISFVEITPKREYRQKIIDVLIQMIDIPELIKPLLLDNGFEPSGDTLKKGDVLASWSKQYIALSSNTRYERMKFTSPSFEQRFKKLLIELSI
jgi:hypothetical protein